MRRFRILLLTGFCAAVAAQGEDPQPNNASAIDTARQDLKKLTATQDRATLTQGRLPSSSVDVPSLNFNRGPEKSDDRDGSSQGWLLDALNGKSADGRLSAERGKPDRLENGGEAGSNPLDRYLNQWLTPESRSILKLNEVNDRALGLNNLPGDKSRNGVDATKRYDTSALLNDARPHGLGEPAANPYLAADNDVAAVVRKSLTEQKSTPRTDLTPLTPQLPLYPTINDKDAAGRETRSTDQDLPPPNAPLINDQRYFPQLRRF